MLQQSGTDFQTSFIIISMVIALILVVLTFYIFKSFKIKKSWLPTFIMGIFFASMLGTAMLNILFPDLFEAISTLFG